MSDKGGPPQPGYNPNAVGAAPGGKVDPQSHFMGLKNVDAGSGLALANTGPGGLVNAKITTGLASDKPAGPQSSQEVQRLWKTKPSFEGFENINSMDVQGIEQAAQSMRGADMQHIGPMPTSALTGLGGISPPATPGFDKGMGMGKGGVGLG